MFRCLDLLFISVIFIMFSGSPLPASAIFPQKTKILSEHHVKKVHGSCHYWRHYCYDHSDGVFENTYYNCLRKRGCFDASHKRRSRHNHYHPSRPSYPARRCRVMRRRCAASWPNGGSDYYGCLRFYNCTLRDRRRSRYY